MKNRDMFYANLNLLNWIVSFIKTKDINELHIL